MYGDKHSHVPMFRSYLAWWLRCSYGMDHLKVWHGCRSRLPLPTTPMFLLWVCHNTQHTSTSLSLSRNVYLHMPVPLTHWAPMFLLWVYHNTPHTHQHHCLCQECVPAYARCFDHWHQQGLTIAYTPSRPHTTKKYLPMWNGESLSTPTF